MTAENEETAVCRGCGRKLNGKPYHMGGHAYDPETKKRCPSNFYGGYVCSHNCDVRAAREHENSMPGHGYDQTARLSCYSQKSVEANWPEYYGRD